MRLRLTQWSPRRGFTLVEMLVSVALLVLMMTVIVSVFQAATGALSTARTYQELDDKLRQLDSTIRQDLNPLNLTATFTPPLNPKDNKGYFEYGENSFPDLQGEDTDDYIRFTTRAPAGQYFTGRFYVAPNPANLSLVQQGQVWQQQPITIQSQYAEIIYFLRNGNLYRRVLLVAPDRQSAVTTSYLNSAIPYTTQPPALGGIWGGASPPNVPVSWQGMNDLSAHPSPVGPNLLISTPFVPIILNTLGDLTNRENRFAYPRVYGDYANQAGGGAPDGIADDLNPDGSGALVGDGIPDYYPTLYFLAFSNPSQLIYETSPASRAANANPFDTMAFPYVYSGAYSVPDTNSASFGWIHTPDPSNNQNTLALLNQLNHAPIDVGDNLPTPGATQTWWGFPTWRETMSGNWIDPVKILSVTTPAFGQPPGLHPVAANTLPTAGGNQLLPPMTSVAPTFYRSTPQPYNDGAGLVYFYNGNLWTQTWEDDLIMTGVRSFDVKAYDNAFAGYVDLGWGDDLRLYQAYVNATGAQIPTTPPYLQGNVGTTGSPGAVYWPPVLPTGGPPAGLTFNILAQTMAHEGRIPPLTTDLRADAQYPNLVYVSPAFNATLSNAFNAKNNALGGLINNIGDDQAGVVRLRRVWDTWSTDYTNARATGYDPTSRLPIGPPFTPPVYPSYPPPYPAPLRGIQIQIRVVDPSNQRIKVLTIRQDFSDKLN